MNDGRADVAEPMSPSTALHADLALGAIGLVLAAVTIWTIVLCVRGSWDRVRSLAAWIFWLSVIVQSLACFVIPLSVMSSASEPASSGEPSDKARVLAESISEGMNSTAPLALATLAAIVVWGAAVWRARRARRAGPGE